MPGRRIGLFVILLAGLLMVPATGLSDHEPGHSGACFGPTSTDDAPLDGWTIVIDPGHGGVDPGAVNEGVAEAEHALTISNLLREELRASGARICQTRTADEYLSLADRAAFANRQDGDMLASIHLNSFLDPDVNYTMPMWDSGRADRRLAEMVLRPLETDLAETPEGEATTINAGRVAQFSSEMLRDADMPAIIVEGTFLSNRWEVEALEDGEWRHRQIARAVHEGIVAYSQRPPMLLRATMPAFDAADFGVRGLSYWLRESGAGGARFVASGVYLLSWREPLRLFGV